MGRIGGKMSKGFKRKKEDKGAEKYDKGVYIKDTGNKHEADKKHGKVFPSAGNSSSNGIKNGTDKDYYRINAEKRPEDLISFLRIFTAPGSKKHLQQGKKSHDRV